MDPSLSRSHCAPVNDCFNMYLRNITSLLQARVTGSSKRESFKNSVYFNPNKHPQDARSVKLIYDAAAQSNIDAAAQNNNFPDLEVKLSPSGMNVPAQGEQQNMLRTDQSQYRVNPNSSHQRQSSTPDQSYIQSKRGYAVET